MKVAFLYPGQGSQEPGMGAALLAEPALAEFCDQAAASTGIDLRRLVTEAPEEELRQTQNAQPALCFTEIALTRLLRERGIEPSAAAGHSVGEYSALAATGGVAANDALRAVTERGRAMADALPAGQSSMAAVVGLDAGRVEAALEGLAGVWAANFNTPSQTVIAGTGNSLEAASAKLRAAGAKRVVPLNVSAAFHTPLMRPAARRLRAALDDLEWASPAVPVIANFNAQPYEDAGEIPNWLERQLYSPVRWSDCVQRLLDLGCDGFVEVGPKRALTGMLRELAPDAYVASVGTVESARQLQLPAGSGIE